MVFEIISDWWNGPTEVKPVEPTPKEDKVGELFSQTMATIRPRLNIDCSGPDELLYSVKVVSKASVKAHDIAMELNLGQTIEPEEFMECDGEKMWMYRFSVPRGDIGYDLKYKIMDHEATTRILAKKDSPHLFYGSCWDIQDPERRKEADHVTPLLKKAHLQHEKTPYHLIVGGGDQCYLDDCLEVIPEFRDLSYAEKCRYQPKDGDAEKLYRHAFKRYIEQGNRPELAKLRERTPFTGEPDDHEFINGWGSLPEELQNCPMYQLIGKIHTEMFLAFQLHSKKDQVISARLPGSQGFSTFYDFGEVAIFNLDTRTERQGPGKQIISKETYEAIEKTYRERCKGKKHVIFNISVPPFYPHATAANSALRALPGYQDLQSDFDDQWEAEGRREEKEYLVDMLLRLQKEFEARNTIVSGDVHSAAFAKIYGVNEDKSSWSENSMANFTTSPVGNDIPIGIAGYFLSWIGYFESKVGNLAKSILLPFPGTESWVSSGETIMGDQNYLSIQMNSAKSLVGTFTFNASNLTPAFEVPRLKVQSFTTAGLYGHEAVVA